MNSGLHTLYIIIQQIVLNDLSVLEIGVQRLDRSLGLIYSGNYTRALRNYGKVGLNLKRREGRKEHWVQLSKEAGVCRLSISAGLWHTSRSYTGTEETEYSRQRKPAQMAWSLKRIMCLRGERIFLHIKRLQDMGKRWYLSGVLSGSKASQKEDSFLSQEPSSVLKHGRDVAKNMFLLIVKEINRTLWEKNIEQSKRLINGE